MKTRASRRARRWNPTIEALDAREVPAALGVPWNDAQHLSLSFAPDGTAIAGHVSSLFQTLDASSPTSAWQREILRAFQTWAVNANINLSPRVDGGQAFGTAGPTQHDPRFGDIRVGAQAMAPSALAITVPGGPAMTGTWAGDVLLNADIPFDDAGQPDAFSVALHEAGHVFGLDDSSNPASAMYASYHAAQAPTRDDIGLLQSLFGARKPDAFEGSSGNGSSNKATQLPTNDGTIPAVAFADVTSGSDVDYYSVRVPSNVTGALTLRLQSRGISLLAPRLTVLDSSNRALGQASASSGFGDQVQVQLPRVAAGATYSVRVEGATRDVFGIGGYGVAAIFESRNTVAAATLDSLLGGDFGTPAPDGVDAILRGRSSSLLNVDGHSNDDANSATRLTAVPGYATLSHYETPGSISDPADVDFYRVQAPSAAAGQDTVLTVTVRAPQASDPTFRVSILDRDFLPVPSQVLANADGTYTIQAAGLRDELHYYVRVSGGDAGNETPDPRQLHDGRLADRPHPCSRSPPANSRPPRRPPPPTTSTSRRKPALPVPAAPTRSSSPASPVQRRRERWSMIRGGVVYTRPAPTPGKPTAAPPSSWRPGPTP
ncbi:MAG: matrixin family metalloprotease [Isosphaeraceae bacterium]